MSGLACPECGARLAVGAERCDLCGSQAGPSPTRPSERSGDSDVEIRAEGIFCNECGWKNPPGASFCSRCGSKLQEPASKGSPLPPPTIRLDREAKSAAGSSIGKHIAILVGLAVLVVVALYMVTVISKQQIPSSANAAVGAPIDVRSASVIEAHKAVPVDQRFASTVDSLESIIAQSDEASAPAARRKLADFMIGIGRIDRAAIEQQRVADATGTLADEIRSADLFFDWMESIEDEEKTDVALLAIEALKKVVNRDAEMLDARAKLGWAYQFDPASPMEAIRHTNQVLEDDPNHIMANYNRAVFLTRINRLSEAIPQFEKVRRLSEEGSLYHRRAEAWLDSIRRSLADNAR